MTPQSATAWAIQRSSQQPAKFIIVKGHPEIAEMGIMDALDYIKTLKVHDPVPTPPVLVTNDQNSRTQQKDDVALEKKENAEPLSHKKAKAEVKANTALKAKQPSTGKVIFTQPFISSRNETLAVSEHDDHRMNLFIEGGHNFSASTESLDGLLETLLRIRQRISGDAPFSAHLLQVIKVILEKNSGKVEARTGSTTHRP